MHFVADTHALVWYLAGSDRLPEAVKSIFESTENNQDTVIIPTIVLAEILHIVEKKRAKLKFREIIEKLEVSDAYLVSPLDTAILKKLIDLSRIKEIHDRIIVATAQCYDAILITKDENIINSKLVKTFWR